jgi:hypothetical protein
MGRGRRNRRLSRQYVAYRCNEAFFFARNGEKPATSSRKFNQIGTPLDVRGSRVNRKDGSPEVLGEANCVGCATWKLPLDWDESTGQRCLYPVAAHETVFRVHLLRQVFGYNSAAFLHDLIGEARRPSGELDKDPCAKDRDSRDASF